MPSPLARLTCLRPLAAGILFAGLGAAPIQASAPRWTVRRALVYARPGGEALRADLYRPAAPGRHPALVAVHGGGWFTGDRSFYARLGPFLAARGFVVLAVDYRLAGAGRKAYPEAVEDVRAALAYLRGHAGAFGVDPRRAGLMGDSAGAHLAALVALDPSAGVKACAAFYGIYDLAAQETRDRAQLQSPTQEGEPDIVRDFMGGLPEADPARYREASPLARLAVPGPRPAFFLAWGVGDEVVDPATQSVPFAEALAKAGCAVTRVPVAGEGHGWATGSLAPGTAAGRLAPQLLAFLRRSL